MSQPVSSGLGKTKHLAINQQQQRHKFYDSEQGHVNDPLLDRKIEEVVSGLFPYYSNVLGKVALSNKENALTIISYINAMRTEANLSDNYRRDLILLLSRFSNYFQNNLSSKR
jgi:hypothetical protein